jgi:hypothetical protein
MDEKLDLVVRSIRRTRNKLGCGFLSLSWASASP